MGVTGTIFDIKKFALHDGPGIRTTVFFKGCPLDCWWCHNPESRSPTPERLGIGTTRESTIGCFVTVDDVMNEILKDRIYYDESSGGATFSGGEPMMQLHFLTALLSECRKNGIHTAVDTCGYAPEEDFNQIYDLVDLILYDLKIMDEAQHVRYTGVTNKLIHANLLTLAGRGEKTGVRVPMIPGITDTQANLNAILAFLKPLPSIQHISLLPYNKLGEDKVERYQLDRPFRQWQPQSVDALKAASDHFVSNGYKVSIGG